MHHITPAELAGILALVETLIEVAKERHDPEWCRRKFIGRARTMLARRNVVAIGQRLPPPDAMSGRKWAAEWCADHCLGCGGCELGRK